MTDLSSLFTSCSIGKKTVVNRLVAQPMEFNGAGPRGSVSQQVHDKYLGLAGGQWGIVFVEATSITPSSLAARGGLVIDRDNLDGYKRMIDDFKRKNPDSLIMIQITHSGIRSKPFSEVTAVYEGQSPQARLLGADEIESIRQAFVEGTMLCHEAGADGIDFKLCHGYLTTELLRPANTRPDKWGGSLENRTRFLREGIEEIKGRLKQTDFILGSRISMYEGLRGGVGTAGPEELIEDLTEVKELVRIMEGLGLDYVNVSAGLPGFTTAMSIPTKASSLVYLNHFRYTKTVKEWTTMKVMGSAYSVIGREAASLAAENIGKGFADFAGFGRQSLADPDFPKKLKAGEKVDACRACMGCGRLFDNNAQSGCVVYNDYYKDLSRKMKTG